MLTLILGASPNPQRYAFLAQERLMAAGHAVLPVSPKGGEILGVPVVRDLAQVLAAGARVDTVTLYVGPDRLKPMAADLAALAPRRVIFNPGTEDADMEAALRQAGIETQEACTLVLLGTGQY